MHMRRMGRSALALTLALLFSMFIACSGSNQNTGNPTHAAELPTAMTSEAPTPEPTPEPYIRLSVDNSEQGRGVAVLVNYCHPYAHTDEITTAPILGFRAPRLMSFLHLAKRSMSTREHGFASRAATVRRSISSTCTTSMRRSTVRSLRRYM